MLSDADPGAFGADSEPASGVERVDDIVQGVGDTRDALLASPAGIVLISGLVLLVVTVTLSVMVRNSPRRDRDRILTARRTISGEKMVRRTLHPRRIRIPFLTPWPFFGALVYGVHVLIIATTGYGKSAGLMMWALAYHARHWSAGKRIRHLLVYDPKAEFFRVLQALYDFFGWRYYVYSMLPEHPASAALNIVATPAMVRTSAGAMWPATEGTEGHFDGKSRQLFAESCDVTEYRGLAAAWALLRDPDRLNAACEHHEGLRRAYTSIPEKERSHIMSTVERPLSLLSDPVVARVFSPDPDTEQPDFSSWDIPCSAHICIDWQEGAELAPLASALQEVLYSAALDAGKEAAGDARGPGTYAYLDEAFSGGLRPRKVASYLAAGRGSRVYTALVAQDRPQLDNLLGLAAAKSTAANSHVKIMGQTDDPDTQEYGARISGMSRISWRPPRASTDEPPKIESIRRTNMLPEHYGELGWAEFFVRSRTPGRSREIIRMPDFGEHAHQLIPPDDGGWAMHGVPLTRLQALGRRLLEGDPEAWDHPWVPEWMRDEAREIMADQDHPARAVLYASGDTGDGPVEGDQDDELID